MPRLGLRRFHTGGEVLHGVVAAVPCTVFPQAVGLGATWNPELLERIGDAIAAEVESLLRRDPEDPLIGPNVWSPVTNLLRDPRWGRNEEGYSEDPHLTAALAIGFCSGLRGGGPDAPPARWRIAPTLKHFLAYNHESDKFASSVGVRPRVLREYDLTPFLEPLRAGVAAAVMPSYHVMNGRPNHLSQHLAVLREIDPDLAVISDGFAPSDLIEKSRYYDDREHAYPAAMSAGVDSFTDHWDDPTLTLQALHRAVELGLLSEREIDDSVRRLLLMRVRVGEFDPPAPDAPPALDMIGDQSHRELAREAVRQSVVLLGNDGLLPLTADAGQTIAVVGPMADRVCRDWYSGPPPYRVTPVDGIIAQAAGTVVFDSGLDRIVLRRCSDGRALSVEGSAVRAGDPDRDEATFELFDWGEGGIALRSVASGLFLSRGTGNSLLCDETELYGWDVKQTFWLEPADGAWVLRNQYSGCYVTLDDSGEGGLRSSDAAGATRFTTSLASSGTQRAAAAARAADVAVVVVGTHPQINGAEGRDREDVGLPFAQQNLAEAVLDAQPRTAVVLVSGHPLAVPVLAGRAPAMLWSSHGGQESGHGLADILFGRYNPAGRLAQSWPRSAESLADIRDYDIIKSRQTYLYADREPPLYPFGHGLSYTTFDYGIPVLDSAQAAAQDSVGITIEVTNTGPVDGDEVVQLYVRSLDHTIDQPLRRLHGFRRIHLPVGASREITFTLPVADLAFWDVGRQRYAVAPGRYEITLGPSSAPTRSTALLSVTAPPLLPRDLTDAVVRAVDFDDYHAIRITDETRRAGEAVAADSAGAWLLYRDVLLGPGPHQVALRVGAAVAAEASEGSGGSRVEFRVGDPVTGRLLGSVAVPATACGRWDWQTVDAVLDAAPGRNDVYLVFTGPARVAALVLAPARPATGEVDV